MNSSDDPIDLALIAEYQMPLAGGQDEEYSEEAEMENFVLIPENAIPIPPSMATIVEERVTAVQNAYRPIHQLWKEAYEKYSEDASGLDGWTSSDLTKENVIRQNIQVLMANAYMRNPHIEFTADDDANTDEVEIFRKLTNNLISKKHRPGLNLKPLINKSSAVAHLTNHAIMKLEFQQNEGSYENAANVYRDVEQRLMKEKDLSATEEAYEVLDTAYKIMSAARHKGASMKLISPFNFFVPADTTMNNFEDAAYTLERIPEKHSTLAAKFSVEISEENEDGEVSTRRVFRYDQSKTFISAEGTATAASLNSHRSQAEFLEEIFEGFDDAAKEELAKDMVVTWEMHDRRSRLKYLYVEGQWDTPLWVWQDDLHLSRYFPYFLLSLSDNIGGLAQPGEVSFYVRMQDALNLINENAMWARLAAFNHWLFDNTLLDAEDAKRIIDKVNKERNTRQVHGVKLKGSGKLSEILEPFKLPSVNFAEVFDKTPIHEAIDRASRINVAMRGQQFKTNTTNDAVATYNQYSGALVDNINDRIEDFVEQIIWALLEVVVSKYDYEQIEQLLSEKDALQFQSMSVEEFNRRFKMAIVAGSTQRPSTEVKKQEARDIIQGLGQFGKAAPRTVLGVVFRVIRDAFSRTYITKDDVKELKEESEQQIAMQQQAMQKSQDPREQSPNSPQ